MKVAETSKSGKFIVVHIRENEETSGSKTSGLEEDEIFDEGVESFAIGDWVLVLYVSEQFPGEITNPKTDLEVNVMHPCGTSNTWKWPKLSNKIYYERKNIVCTINPPKVAGNRGQFPFETF